MTIDESARLYESTQAPCSFRDLLRPTVAGLVESIAIFLAGCILILLGGALVQVSIDDGKVREQRVEFCRTGSAPWMWTFYLPCKSLTNGGGDVIEVFAALSVLRKPVIRENREQCYYRNGHCEPYSVFHFFLGCWWFLVIPTVAASIAGEWIALLRNGKHRTFRWYR